MRESVYPFSMKKGRVTNLKKRSQYRIRKEKIKKELKEYEKTNKLTKKERKALHEWVDAGFDVYESDSALFPGFSYIDSLRAEKELDDLLNGLTKTEQEYVYDYCMDWNPYLDEPFFNLEKLDELDLKHLPVQAQEEYEQTLDIPEDDLPF